MPKVNLKAKTCNCGFDTSCIQCKPGGPAGPQGYQGGVGLMGPQGLVGVQGSIGYGETGFQGPQGGVGLAGSQGNQGGLGFQGAQGSDAETTGLDFDIDTVCSLETHIAITPGALASTNASVSLGPKVGGLGFISAQKPTPGFAVGGDCRGQLAVDWQMARLVSTEVASGDYAFIGAGRGNAATGAYSVVVGGSGNRVTVNNGVILGGISNVVSNAGLVPSMSGILTGKFGQVSSRYSAILTGLGGVVSGQGSWIGSGYYQVVSGQYSVIGSGNRNQVGGAYNLIGTGNMSVIGSSLYSSILNGVENSIAASCDHSLILGGASQQVVNGIASLIGTGYLNVVNAENSNSILNGTSNVISGAGFLVNSTILNGNTNLINSSYSLIGSGRNGTIGLSSDYSTILNGRNGYVGDSDYGAVLGGRANLVVSSEYSVIGGGSYNVIFSAEHSSIVNGRSNYISNLNSGGGVGSGMFSILGGLFNVINPLNDGSVSLAILSGSNNTLNGSVGSNSVIIGGSGNLISGGVSALIGGGMSNVINSSGVGAAILTGQVGVVSATGAVILNGIGNVVSGSGSGSLVGGGDSLVGAHSRAVVLGGSAFSSQLDDSINLGGRLFVKSVPYSFANKVMMWNSVTYAVEYKDLGSFVSGGGDGGGVTGLAGSYDMTTCGGFVALAPSVVLPGNASMIIGPKGAGFLAAQIPDYTSVGGNCRGINAIDFQMNRLVASGVASGNFSSLLSGQNNMASGAFSSVIGGLSNSSIGGYSVIGNGLSNSVLISSQFGSVLNGRQNGVASLYGLVAGGRANQISLLAPYSVVLNGYDNQVNAAQSVVLNGVYHRIYESGLSCYLNTRNVVIGGSGHVIGGTHLTNALIGNGNGNLITGAHQLNSVILNGSGNVVNVSGSSYLVPAQGGVIVSGVGNTVTGSLGVVLSGRQGLVSGDGAVILNGTNQVASGVGAVVAGGQNNLASGDWSMVVGGSGSNVASGIGSAVLASSSAVASGTGAVVLGSVGGGIASHIQSVLIGGSGFNSQSESSVNLGGGHLFLESVPGASLEDKILVWNSTSLEVEYREAGTILSSGVSILGVTGVCSGEDHLEITPSSALSANASLSVGPKGSGFLSAQMPDGTVVGGNCRGQNAVDWQMARLVSGAEVASGDFSVVSGGMGNLAGGLHSVVVGGLGNVAGRNAGGGLSGTGAFVGGGQYNLATGAFSSVVGGSGNRVYGRGSLVVGGFGNLVSRRAVTSSILGGSENLVTTSTAANSFNCTIVGGLSNVINSSDGGSQNVIVSGEANLIDGDYSMSSAILNGMNNHIYDSSYSSVMGGLNHLITRAYHSAIIGGVSNTVTGGVLRSVVLGGTNLKAIHHNAIVLGGSSFNSNDNDSVNIGGRTFIKDVPNDNSQLKFVTWDSSSYLLKYRNLSSFTVNGPQGMIGHQGNQGFLGFPGAPGAVGSQGAKGSQGNQGGIGIRGETGFQGLRGYQGVTGAAGFGLGTISSSISPSLCSGWDHVAILPYSGLTYDSSISVGPNPLGLGFVSAQAPLVGSFIGGNCRGQKAVDWQMKRATAYQVASGNYSVICGGRSNAALGGYTFVGGGFGNTAGGSGTGAFVGGGVSNKATGVYSCVVAGQGNSALATGAFVGAGQGNSARGQQSAIIGGAGNNVLNGHDYAIVLGGAGLTSKGANTVLLGGKPYLNNVSGPMAATVTRVLVWDNVTQEVGFRQASGLIRGMNVSYTYNLCGTYDHLAIKPETSVIDVNSSISVGPDPSGKGFISGHRPTNTALGGVCRGFGAVDWQLKRNLLTQVAAGNYSFLGGGQNNRVSAVHGAIIGGYSNSIDALGMGSVILGGYSHNVSGYYSAVLAGSNHTIAYDHSAIIGGDSLTSPGPSTVLIGGDLYVQNVDGPYNTLSYVLVWDPSSKKVVYRTAASLSGGGGGGGGGDFGPTGFDFSVAYSLCPCSGPVSDHVAIKPSSLMTVNASISIGPKGNGFISAQIPTCTASGGNCRGTNAVDFQLSRSLNTQVASGTRSLIGNGQASQAIGLYSTVINGHRNVSSGNYGLVGNGLSNTASGLMSTVVNGKLSKASGVYSSILGGYKGVASNTYSLILGGKNGISSGKYSVVGNGISSLASGNYSSVLNGRRGVASGLYALVGSGLSNTASATFAVVLGGSGNRVSSTFGLIGGGRSNTVQGLQQGGSILSGRSNLINAGSGYDFSLISGGVSNSILGGYASVIVGGQSNLIEASSHRSGIMGGRSNRIMAGGNYSMIGGGQGNTVSSNRSAVIGGRRHVIAAGGNYSFIGGGLGSTVSGLMGSILGGSGHQIGLLGARSAVVGGRRHTVSGADSVVVGGSGHTMTHSRAVILGGGGSGGLTSKGVDTTLVGGRLFVESVSGPYNYANKILVWDSVSREVQYRDVSSIINGGTGGGGGGGGGASGMFVGVYSDFCSVGQDLLVVRPDTAVMSSNSSLAIGPIGSGFLSAQKPNFGLAGGNCRGNRAVDLQMKRLLASQVASGNYSLIGGGASNTVSSKYSSIVGGLTNTIGSVAYYSGILGGRLNSVTGLSSSVVGGQSNSVAGDRSAVIGGVSNTISAAGDYSFIGVVKNGSVTNLGGLIVAGTSQTVSGKYGAILGGRSNTVVGKYGLVLNGRSGRASGTYSTVLNGHLNVASGYNSFVAGGKSNTAGGKYSAVIQGTLNQANALGSVVVTGMTNMILAGGNYSSILSGIQHTVTHKYASIVSGVCKQSKGDSTTLIGGRLFIDTVNNGTSPYFLTWNNVTQEVEKQTFGGFGSTGTFTEINVSGDTNVGSDLVVGGDVVISGKLTVTGLIDPTGLVLDAQPFVPVGATGLNKGVLWVQVGEGGTGPTQLVFSDSLGHDQYLYENTHKFHLKGGLSTGVEPILGGNSAEGDYSLVANGVGNMILSGASSSSVIGGDNHLINHDHAVIIGGSGLTSKGSDTVLIGGQLYIDSVDTGSSSYFLIWDAVSQRVEKKLVAGLGATGNFNEVNILGGNLNMSGGGDLNLSDGGDLNLNDGGDLNMSGGDLVGAGLIFGSTGNFVGLKVDGLAEIGLNGQTGSPDLLVHGGAVINGDLFLDGIIRSKVESHPVKVEGLSINDTNITSETGNIQITAKNPSNSVSIEGIEFKNGFANLATNVVQTYAIPTNISCSNTNVTTIHAFKIEWEKLAFRKYWTATFSIDLTLASTSPHKFSDTNTFFTFTDLDPHHWGGGSFRGRVISAGFSHAYAIVKEDDSDANVVYLPEFMQGSLESGIFDIYTSPFDIGVACTLINRNTTSVRCMLRLRYMISENGGGDLLM